MLVFLKLFAVIVICVVWIIEIEIRGRFH